jgi:hypothetical protein
VCTVLVGRGRHSAGRCNREGLPACVLRRRGSRAGHGPQEGPGRRVPEGAKQGRRGGGRLGRELETVLGGSMLGGWPCPRAWATFVQQNFTPPRADAPGGRAIGWPRAQAARCQPTKAAAAHQCREYAAGGPGRRDAQVPLPALPLTSLLQPPGSSDWPRLSTMRRNCGSRVAPEAARFQGQAPRYREGGSQAAAQGMAPRAATRDGSVCAAWLRGAHRPAEGITMPSVVLPSA